MRQLWWMARGAWDVHASILVALHEPYRDRDVVKAPYQLADFHPFREVTKRRRDPTVLPYDPQQYAALIDGKPLKG